MVVQVVGALLSGSLALLADAAHMLTDVAALIIALIASAVAARPANERSTFGYRRAEVFGALANGVILIVLSVGVAWEAVRRLLEPGETEVAGGPDARRRDRRPRRQRRRDVAARARRSARSINVRGAYLEVLGDLIGSAAVIVAAIVILMTGWMPADALASLFIAAMIVPARDRAAARGRVGAVGGGAEGHAGRRHPRPPARRAGRARTCTTCTCGSSPAGRRCSRRTSSSTRPC